MAHKFFTALKARFFSAASDVAVDVGVAGDDHSRFRVDAGGRITWGPGDAAGDVYVQRVDAGAVNFVGDVGVNTAAPAYELDVTGTIGTNRISFDTGTNDLLASGDVAWDDLDQALAYRTGDLKVDIGQENLVYVRNASGGSTITKGSVVAVLGADANRLSVQLCDATAGAGVGCRTVGVAMQNITSPGFGFVSTFGLLRGFNTGNIVGTAPVEPGAELFISSTPGVLSTDPQPSPGRRVTVGYVVTVGTQGSIFVTIRRGLTVNELDNVIAPSPTDGDVLTYDSTQGVWTGASASLVGNLDDLSDVQITDPQPDQIIVYDGSVWLNASASFGGKVTVSPTAPTEDLEEGALWFSSVDGLLFMYYDGFWIEVSGAPGPQGAQGDTGDFGIAISTTSPSTDQLWADLSEEGAMVVPAGGTLGQVLVKKSDDDYDTEWGAAAIDPYPNLFMLMGA